MDIKELNDTLVAHAVLELAFRLQQNEVNLRLQDDPKNNHIIKPVKDFIPAAVTIYGELREAIKAAPA